MPGELSISLEPGVELVRLFAAKPIVAGSRKNGKAGLDK